MAITKTDYQIEVINRVRTLRTRNEVSQQQLAELLGISTGTVGNIESLRYSNKYTLSQLRAMSQYFKVPIESFFMATHDEAITLDECIGRICEYMEGN